MSRAFSKSPLIHRFLLEGFLDLPEMENVVGVCITHMDQVSWTENEFRMSLDGELGIRSVVFSSMETSGIRWLNLKRNLCLL
jgi:hypothetical protein